MFKNLYWKNKLNLKTYKRNVENAKNSLKTEIEGNSSSGKYVHLF